MPLSTESLLHLEQDFLALNQRIARLATHLGLELPDESSVQQALHTVSLQLQSGRSPLHEQHLWLEFRGLLVLRYRLEAHSVQAVGAPRLQAVLQHAQTRLARKGIGPEHDGVHLDELFGPAEVPDTRP